MGKWGRCYPSSIDQSGKKRAFEGFIKRRAWSCSHPTSDRLSGRPLCTHPTLPDYCIAVTWSYVRHHSTVGYRRYPGTHPLFRLRSVKSLMPRRCLGCRWAAWGERSSADQRQLWANAEKATRAAPQQTHSFPQQSYVVTTDCLVSCCSPANDNSASCCAFLFQLFQNIQEHF